jgi:hypothetical protein
VRKNIKKGITEEIARIDIDATKNHLKSIDPLLVLLKQEISGSYIT